jgi:hypothetical protein
VPLGRRRRRHRSKVALEKKPMLGGRRRDARRVKRARQTGTARRPKRVDGHTCWRPCARVEVCWSPVCLIKHPECGGGGGGGGGGAAAAARVAQKHQSSHANAALANETPLMRAKSHKCAAGVARLAGRAEAASLWREAQGENQGSGLPPSKESAD